MHYRRLIALLMVCAYLLLPLDSFAGHQSPVGSALPAASSGSLDRSLPGGVATATAGAFDQTSLSTDLPAGCPCSDQHDRDGHHADGCDGCSCCSCCSFLAPLPAVIAWSALPPPDSFITRDPIQRFPEVYLPIFVPPQNRG